jgi:isoamylase
MEQGDGSGRVVTQRASWDSAEGAPSPLGVSWIAATGSYNFALYSRFAHQVTLLLYAREDPGDPVFSYRFQPMKNRTGHVWHARVSRSETKGATYYAYSVAGPPSSPARFEWHAFNPDKSLLDPYARAVFLPPSFGRNFALGGVANAGHAPLGVLCDPSEPEFDWGNDPRPRHDSDLIICELHVRGFTANPNSGVSHEKTGTFAGIAEKIPYLVELGVTAVEIMPVAQFDDTEPDYWGYMPLSFFCPHHRYATKHGGCEQIREFREMVKALHGAGIEVILDVVYNHTGEGNESGPTFSFKGIDNSTYYMASRDPLHPYADYTGTGNTLNCNNAAVRQLVVDSLRYWVREMHVDGFRFDLASVFARNSDGSINFNDPPIFGDLATDPDLAGVRMIAEPWEGNPAHLNYQLGRAKGERSDPAAECCPHCGVRECRCTLAETLQRSFPGVGWRQWNDQFRNVVRRFVKGDSGMVPELMTRVYGSSDVFPDLGGDAYRPYQSLNYISSHDGLTLYDLVTYNSPDSWNCGGPDGEAGAAPLIMRLRKQQVRNFCCLLFLSNGTPMFRAGDEFLQTQEGDPNPYNVDSSKTWLDWGRRDTHGDIFRFFKMMIAFRKKHPSLSRSLFWRDDIRWYGTTGRVDLSDASRTLAWCLDGGSESDNDIYVMINGYWEAVAFALQEGSPHEWSRVIDTALDSPGDFVDPFQAAISAETYVVAAHSIVVFVRS